VTERHDPDLARLLAYEEIRQLVARYAVAVDSRDLETLVGLFDEDVRVGRDRRGRGALREYFELGTRSVGVTILNVGTHLITLDADDRARGVVYCRAELQIRDRWIVQAIQYRDDYVRRNGQWFFVKRDHLLWYGRDVGTNPLGLPRADWPEHQTGWGTLPEEWPTWGEFWGPDAPRR